MQELKLYEAPAIMEELVNQVDEDGCITEEAINKLNTLELAIEEKAKGITIISNRLNGFTDTIDDEIKRLQSLKKTYKNNADRLKDYLAYNLKELGKDKLETDLYKFTFRKSESVVVDEEKLDPAYMKVTQKFTPDKTLIKSELKEGKVIEGATLLEKDNLQIK